MSKMLIIKGADFTANALDNIDYAAELSTIKSSLNVRAIKYNNGSLNNHFTLFNELVASGEWYTYIADVSEYVGKTCKIRANNGYASQIVGNGAFVNSNFPSKTQGFTISSDEDYETAVVGNVICAVTSSADSNKDVFYEYTIPQGASKVVVTSKTEVKIFIKKDDNESNQ